ncbi:cupin [Bacillaceae bacterium Marseille-Q3522]|nr:cupin [Bacillaceae bacterium Marseille-Q3522]
MKIFRFDQAVGKPIKAFGSSFDMSRIGVYSGEIHIGCMHFDKNGLVGRHKATTNQLFLVIEGEGWVCGKTEERVTVHAGQAAFWEKDESHEAGTTDYFMKAIVIEGENLYPEKFMSLI